MKVKLDQEVLDLVSDIVSMPGSWTRKPRRLQTTRRLASRLASTKRDLLGEVLLKGVYAMHEELGTASTLESASAIASQVARSDWRQEASEWARSSVPNGAGAGTLENFLAWLSGSIQTTHELMDSACTLSNELSPRPSTEAFLAINMVYRGDLKAAGQIFASLAESRVVDGLSRSTAFNNLGWVHAEQGHLLDAQRAHERASLISQTSGFSSLMWFLTSCLIGDSRSIAEATHAMDDASWAFQSHFERGNRMMASVLGNQAARRLFEENRHALPARAKDCFHGI